MNHTRFHNSSKFHYELSFRAYNTNILSCFFGVQYDRLRVGSWPDTWIDWTVTRLNRVYEWALANAITKQIRLPRSRNMTPLGLPIWSEELKTLGLFSSGMPIGQTACEKATNIFYNHASVAKINSGNPETWKSVNWKSARTQAALHGNGYCLYLYPISKSLDVGFLMVRNWKIESLFFTQTSLKGSYEK